MHALHLGILFVCNGASLHLALIQSWVTRPRGMLSSALVPDIIDGVVSSPGVAAAKIAKPAR